MLPEVIVDIGAAVICFMSTCYPALVGKDTPIGEYQLVHYSTDTPGYGGNLLVFKEDDNEVFAIHRVLDIPGQNRFRRIRSDNVKDRQTITAGCVNIEPAVFDLLVDCCYASKVTIK
jgi:hypothetical protein